MKKLNKFHSKVVKDKGYMLHCLEHYPCYPCELMGYDNWNEARQFHHIQYPRRGAMIRDDSNGVVVCFNCHTKIHTKFGERLFWQNFDIDPTIKAKEMYELYREKKDAKNKRSKNKKPI